MLLSSYRVRLRLDLSHEHREARARRQQHVHAFLLESISVLLDDAVRAVHHLPRVVLNAELVIYAHLGG